ncbi:MAG TPA: hypothetical protein VFF79_13015 [Conexibacter sp.]|jgi:hypothetical protein|nr:hypothetical protein [Conexibacter sp.]
MSADSQSPKVDERRWVLRGQIHGLDTAESVEVVPASLVDELRAELLAANDRYEHLAIGRDAEQDQSMRLRSERDTARDALREIADVIELYGHYLTYHAIAGILANGPLATAPGGEREDECARLRAENDDLKRRVRDYAGLDAAEVQRRAYVTHEHHLSVIRALVAERKALRAEVDRLTREAHDREYWNVQAIEAGERAGVEQERRRLREWLEAEPAEYVFRGEIAAVLAGKEGETA